MDVDYHVAVVLDTLKQQSSNTLKSFISRPFLDKDSIWQLFQDRVDLQNGVGGVS